MSAFACIVLTVDLFRRPEQINKTKWYPASMSYEPDGGDGSVRRSGFLAPWPPHQAVPQTQNTRLPAAAPTRRAASRRRRTRERAAF